MYVCMYGFWDFCVALDILNWQSSALKETEKSIVWFCARAAYDFVFLVH